MATWVRHYADVRPRLGIVQVIEQTYEGNHPRFKRKRIRTRVVKEVPIAVTIPVKEYEKTVTHHDDHAWSVSEREWTTIEKYTAHDKDVIAQLKSDALQGFNTEPLMFHKEGV